MKIIQLSSSLNSVVRQEVVECLKKGGVVVFPSDTVYGLLADATNPDAVSKLLAFKDRQPGKAVSVFVKDLQMMEKLCFIPSEKKEIVQKILPGRYTVVLDSKHTVDPRLESETGTLGTRFIAYDEVIQLVKEVGKPLTATSANLGGRSPHYSATSFLHDLPKKKEQYIDIVVDAGELPHNKPSTVIDFTTPDVKILRLGDSIATDAVLHTSLSADSTHDLGYSVVKEAVARCKQERIVFILKGDLGAGKTQFVKGVASYFTIHDIVSPTFVVYYEYDIPESVSFKRLYHFDLYNIENEEEFEHLGIKEILNQKAIICIEWGEKLGDQFEAFKKDSLVYLVTLEHVNETTRKIAIQPL